MPGEGLLGIIQQAVRAELGRSGQTDFIFGTVKSAAPLVIQPEEKLPLDADFFVLSAFCKPFSVGGTQLWRGLAAGDCVRMLQCVGGQKFYVLDREGLL